MRGGRILIVCLLSVFIFLTIIVLLLTIMALWPSNKQITPPTQQPVNLAPTSIHRFPTSRERRRPPEHAVERTEQTRDSKAHTRRPGPVEEPDAQKKGQSQVEEQSQRRRRPGPIEQPKEQIRRPSQPKKEDEEPTHDRSKHRVQPGHFDPNWV